MVSLVVLRIIISFFIALGCVGKLSRKEDVVFMLVFCLFYKIDDKGFVLGYIFYFDGIGFC